jgi:methanogenic corrinoid protein MtbC1
MTFPVGDGDYRRRRQPKARLVGDAPLNVAFAEDIEAGTCLRDAVIAMETAENLLALKRREVTQP